MTALVLLVGLARADPPAPQAQQQRFGPKCVARLELDAREVRLSGRLTLTVTVEGPAPLAVSPPDPLLADNKPPRWRARPLPPAAADTPGRWQRVYRLDPLAAGEAVAV